MKKQSFKDLRPGPIRSVPEPPPGLNDDGREAWETGARYLVDRGLLHTGDLYGLELWASSIAMLRRINSEMAGEDLLLDSQARGMKSNPLMALLAREQSTARQWSSALLLAPAARAKLPNDIGDDTPTAEGTGWDSVIEMPKRGQR
jgi:phage terminase small subunit